MDGTYDPLYRSGLQFSSADNAEGINVRRAGFATLRFGLVMNNEPECDSPDTFVGLGGWRPNDTVGNWSGVIGMTRGAQDFGYVMIR